MYTSMVVALAGAFAGADAGSAPAWQSDYRSAQQAVSSAGKPLAVFIASGKDGFNSLVRGGKLTPEIQELLESKYVPLYLDTATPAGKKLAAVFELRSGIVISDKTGELQAFRHEGDLTPAAMARYLVRYSDPNRAVVTTDTNPGPDHEATVVPTSIVSPVMTGSAIAPAYAGSVAPAIGGVAYPSNSFAPSFGGGSCPNCSGGGGFRRR